MVRGVVTVLVLAAGAAVMSGCQSKGPRVHDEYTDVTRAFSPAWYEASPRGDDGSILKTAQGVGLKPRISESFAVNQARQQMALAIESRVDVLQRAFTEQIETPDDPEVLERFQDANNIVASTTLRGSHVIKKETFLEPSGQYRTFVMMELDATDLEKNYEDTLREMGILETRLRSGEAWADLERRADELRRERQNGPSAPMTDEQIRGGR